MIYILLISLIVIVIILAVVLLSAIPSSSAAEAGNLVLTRTGTPTSMPVPPVVVPAQPANVSGTAPVGTAPALVPTVMPEAGTIDDDFIPVEGSAGSVPQAARFTSATTEEVEEVFMPLPDEVRDFRSGGRNDDDPDALCWLTGQSVSVCTCEDCQGWRERRDF